jgi:hypothetical protein
MAKNSKAPINSHSPIKEPYTASELAGYQSNYYKNFVQRDMTKEDVIAFLGKVRTFYHHGGLSQDHTPEDFDSSTTDFWHYFKNQMPKVSEELRCLALDEFTNILAQKYGFSPNDIIIGNKPILSYVRKVCDQSGCFSRRVRIEHW